MSAIKVGDWVMCVRPALCCGSTRGIGQTAIVENIRIGDARFSCCSKELVEVFLVDGFNETLQIRGTSTLSRLIKIDPPAIHESIESTKELTA